MKKILLTTISASLFLFASCDKLKELASFSQSFDYKQIVDVPGLPSKQVTLPQGGASESLPRFGVATNSAQYINENRTSADLITDVLLSKMSMNIISPANGHFDYIDTVKLFLSASASGADEQLVAYKYNIPKGQNTVVLDVTNINLKPYFLKDSMYYRIYGHFVDIPVDETKVEVNTTLTMKASLLQ